MKAIIILSHGDDVSGTTIMDDGTKAYWTEGRSSTVVALRPDGKVTNHGPMWDSDEIMEVLSSDQYGTVRRMNLLEEHEHNMMRNFGEIVGRVEHT